MMGRGTWTVLAAVALACGPSGKEMKAAKTAQYSCPAPEVFAAVKAAVEAKAPPLGETDEAKGVVTSQFRWHGKNGETKTEGSSRILRDDVQFRVIAMIKQEGDGFSVTVEPKVIGQMAGNIQGRPLTREDGDWPPFADGKVDAVVFEVYQRLKKCAK